MNFAHIGIGLGGLATGVRQGLAIGQTIKGIRDENAIDDVRSEGIEAANQARAADVESAYADLRKQGIDDAEARAKAEAATDPVGDYYGKTVYPKVYEAYVGQGDMEKAAAWQSFYENQNTKSAMKHWAAAMKAAAAQDYEGFGKALAKTYNAAGYFEDGGEARNAKPIYDAAGNFAGFEVTLFDKKSNKETVQRFEGTEDVLRTGLNALSPERTFEFLWSEQLAANKAALDLAAEDRKHGRNLETLGHANSLGMQRDAARAQREAAAKQGAQLQEFEAKLGALRQFGFSDTAIKEMVPELLGAGQFRKGANPTELRLRVLEMLTKNDLAGNFSKLPPEEQARAADEVLRALSEQGEVAAEPAPSGGAAAAPSGGIPVLNVETGEIEYR